MVGLFLVFRSAPAKMVDTCVPFQSVPVGAYVVETDYWNKTKCPGAQCLRIDDQTGTFTLTSDSYSCGYDVAAYPNILFGQAWGVTSAQKDLPAPVKTLQCVMSDWTIHPTDTGTWDAAYDIWASPDPHCGPHGFPGGLEIMVWLDYRNTHGWKNDLGTVSIEGVDWEVWQATMNDGKGSWQYVAYLPKTLMTSVKDLDLKKFLDDSQKRGYLRSDWYLYAVQAGNEMHSGGVPFTSEGFSVTVNKNNTAAFTFVPADPSIRK